MKFEKLIVILPCQTLEGYWLDRRSENADELLSAWSALYHPALVAGAQALPDWASADDPPKDPAGSLILLPKSSRKIVAAEWLDQAEASAACVIRDARDRDEILAVALGQLDPASTRVDPPLAADFLALGFCHLQIEVLSRDAGYDMGTDVQYYDEQYYDYGQQLDRQLFSQRTISAAEAALKGDEQTAREHLRTAFDQLAEARRALPYTYSSDQDPHLLDLTLLAPTTLGQSLRDELAKPGPANLLVSAHVIQQMAEREPSTLAALKEALGKKTAVIIGGEFDEAAIPLLTPEAILEHFKRGLAAYEQHLGEQPRIFGRRRFGLSPVLPQLLRKLGFAGAVHFTLDDGRFPTSGQGRIWWVGVDGTELEALAQLPLDASQPGPFLNFASKVSNTSYKETNATAVLAHWPGRSSPWYRDLQRAAAYAPVLGQFRTITEYLEETHGIRERVRSGPDEYRSPYLRQAVARQEADPISRWVRYHRRRAAAEAAQTLGAMADMAGGALEQEALDESLLRDIEEAETAGSDPRAELDDRLQRWSDQAATRFLALLPRQNAAPGSGCLIANPWSFPRRALVDASGLDALPAVGGPIRAAGESDGRKQVVVEVPAMGFAWVGSGSATPPVPEQAGRKRRKAKKREKAMMAEDNVLRNEYFEVTVNPATGAIQAIDDYVSRGARLAQQLALRQPRPKSSSQEGFEEEDPEQDYSRMAADAISVTSSGPVVARIVSRGRLLSRDGQRLARFVQTIEAWQGSPILELKIDLDIECQPDPDPWNSYYAARFAWGDAAADVYRSVCLASRPTERPQVEAPHFVDVRSGDRHTTILTTGLPYHRRFGLRKLDTLLVVRGETARSFRLGIGIDLKYPVRAALDFLAPQHVLAEQAPPASGQSGWLFHVDAKNVVATHWDALCSEGRITGFRARLLETEGRRCRVGLRSFRPIGSAHKVDFRGENPTELSVQDDTITFDVGPHEWVQIECKFAE